MSPPREYDVTPPPTRHSPRVQIRIAFSTERGDVIRFLVQLEYWHRGEWRPVVRYDHDRDGDAGHDVAVEGLHRDVYRAGEKVRVESVSPPIPADEAFEYAEDDLGEHAKQYVRRFERWHDIQDSTSL